MPDMLNECDWDGFRFGNITTTAIVHYEREWTHALNERPILTVIAVEVLGHLYKDSFLPEAIKDQALRLAYEYEDAEATDDAISAYEARIIDERWT